MIRLVLLSLLLTGCAATAPFPTTTGSRYVLLTGTPDGPGPLRIGEPVYFKVPPGVKWLWPCAYSADTAAANGVSLTAACPFVVTDAREADEAWMFEARLPVRMDGIPFGRAPSDFVVIGTRDQCEAIRLSSQTRANWKRTLEPVPTEPCKGPLYLKREDATTTR